MAEVKKISDEIILKVVHSASLKTNRLHVVPRESTWVVRRDGSARAMGVYDTKDEAVTVARSQVEEGRADYAVVHDNTGRVLEKITA